MRVNNYKEKAEIYAQHNKDQGTLLLAYQEFGSLFSKYVTSGGEKALDFGSGVGRSRIYLEKVGFDADGVDIDEDMVTKARELDKNNEGRYQLISDSVIPHRASKYDLAFSSLVVLEMSSKEEILNYFAEAYRTMKFDGTFIVLTVNDDFYKHQWVSVDTAYPGNADAKSGDKVRVKIKEINLELDDFYWTKDDYREIAKNAGFTILEEVEAKATEGDSIEWISEREYAPFVIFVMKKTVSLESKEEIALKNGLDIHLPGKGFFAETSRDLAIIPQMNLPSGYSGDRNVSATVRILMTPGGFWPFHKLKSGERFKHIEGSDIILHCINNAGHYTRVCLGVEHEEAIREYTVPNDIWYAEEFSGLGGYALFEATTTPAFHPDDMEEICRQHLIEITKGQDKTVIDLINKFYPGDPLKKTVNFASSNLLLMSSKNYPPNSQATVDFTM